MKKKLNHLMLKVLSILLVGTMITSCGKDGAVGPKGDTGATGANGAPGAPGATGTQGIPGKDGAVIIAGTGAPASTTGNNGDMYLDKSTSNLYGPKTTAGWGLSLSLKGDAGQIGANGSTILNGTVAPTAAIGVNGDYFLNKTTADLYGPKTAGAWGTAINLRGTANVVATTWMNLKPWEPNPSIITRFAHYPIPNPVLNAVGYADLDAMLDKGGILLVFFANGAFSYPVPSSPYLFDVSMYSQRNTNSFDFVVTGTNNTALPAALNNTPDNGTYKIRYVLVPAGLQITANLKNKSLDEVKTLFNLKD
ncbi:MAG TPA: collagen-like protein [Pedobacter sp.]|nr:collagen-like protein [Pedobacter sp.]